MAGWAVGKRERLRQWRPPPQWLRLSAAGKESFAAAVAAAATGC